MRRISPIRASFWPVVAQLTADMMTIAEISVS
jgi:hypothetical protein